MTPDALKQIQADISAMSRRLDEIYTAVVGAEDLGHDGLVARVKSGRARLLRLEISMVILTVSLCYLAFGPDGLKLVTRWLIPL